MIKFRNLLKVCVDYKGRTICALNDECSDPIACVKEMLLAGKYWITKEETGEIFPPMPEELLEANAGLGLGTSASYLIHAPNFDQESYWASVGTNPPYFKKKTHFTTDISCEKILELDKANIPAVELFNALADVCKLSPKELMSYLVQKL